MAEYVVTSCACGMFGETGCHAITHTEGDRVLWVSHAPADTHPECRMDEAAGVNAKDKRRSKRGTVTARKACDACEARLSRG